MSIYGTWRRSRLNPRRRLNQATVALALARPPERFGAPDGWRRHARVWNSRAPLAAASGCNCCLVKVRLGLITGIPANGTQTSATAALCFGAIDLCHGKLYEKRDGSERAKR